MAMRDGFKFDQKKPAKKAPKKGPKKPAMPPAAAAIGNQLMGKC